MTTVAKRVAISLTVAERDELQQLAHAAGEPIATVAGRLVRAALADHGAQLDTPPARRAGSPRGRRVKRRPAPATDAPTGTLDALRARYPRELRHLPADLDGDTYLAEQTAAFIAWRDRLDAAGTDADPREVLAFGYELRTFALFLQDRARRSR
ncbi:MAG TPA: hypothetical protein VN635_12360 [Conexibacter sp.]|nr:hypothetical protein [Conexibacter sp.]